MKYHHNMRAFDKNKGRYIGNLFSYLNSTAIRSERKVLFGDYDIELCTGIRDKNGSFIYEGDFVKCLMNWRPGIGWEENICLVSWVDYARFGLEYGIYSGSDAISMGDVKAEGGIEVIGNIHQNPELLKAQ